MSAKILQFVPKPQRNRRSTESRNEFRSPIQADDLVMYHADSAPCEYSPGVEDHVDNEPM